MQGLVTFRSGHLARAQLVRGLAAGVTWGTVVSVGLLGLALYQCGGVCLADIVETVSLSIAAGVAAIGPVAALAHRH